jgi:hypothetical protein
VENEINVSALLPIDIMEQQFLESKPHKELQGLCKKKGLKASGKKSDLIKRLLDQSSGPKQTTLAPIPQTILETFKTSIYIKRNLYGNFEHLATHFVFDPETQKVIGKQDNANVIALTPEDIDTCKTLGFLWVVDTTLAPIIDELEGKRHIEQFVAVQK